jgi:hypothetical protein
MLKVAELACKADTDAFDRETKCLEKEMREHQRIQRDELAATHQRELVELEEHWKTPAKLRLYNRASNKLATLRRQLAFLLVQCKFRDAEEVCRMVEEEARLEEAESHRAMQVDYDAALKLELMRQSYEITGFDTSADMQFQKSIQDIGIQRSVYENLGKKITTREEVVTDPEKLWNLEQARRSHAIVGNIGKPQLPSAKLARKDIKDSDVAIQNLPPLASRGKHPKKEKKAQNENEEA